MSVSSNVINGTFAGVNIGPATYDTQDGKITITGNTIRNADYFGIAVVGDNTRTPSKLDAVSITGNVIKGVNNYDNQTGESNLSGIIVRSVKNAAITGNTIVDANGLEVDGILAIDVEDITISSNTIENTDEVGINVSTAIGSIIVDGNIVKSCGADGIKFNTVSTARLVVSDNSVASVVDYGIASYTDLHIINISNNIVEDVTGNGMGVYVPSVLSKAVLTGNISTATTPFYNGNNTADVIEIGNSWN